MNANDDWARWGEHWQQQPVVDTDQLYGRVRRKYWRMCIVVALELLVTLTVVIQLLWFITLPEFALRWKGWALFTLVFVLGLQGLFLHIRRGTWRASADSVTDLLWLTMRRAQAGIRLAKVQAWSTAIEVVITLLTAIPELVPQRWQHDPALKWIITLQFSVNAPIVLGVFALCLWYSRRQHHYLRRTQELLRAYED